MSNYDGPSFFKDSHPKIQPMDQKQSKKNQQSKYELPKNIRTQDDLKDEARQHMTNRKTPSYSVPQDPPPERFPFKNKHIPSSLQKLDGWRQPDSNKSLYTLLQERLEKDEASYLLFEEHLSDEMKTKFEDEQPKREAMAEKSARPKDVVQEQVAEIHKEVATNVTKPGTGLHRSLSNIMAEEQLGIQKSKHKLNSLFDENKKSSKK